MADKYKCPKCGNDEADDLRAMQACMCHMGVGEYEEPDKHHLVDAELGDNYFGPVYLNCGVCNHDWEQEEIK
jgi:hypothetical protein